MICLLCCRWLGGALDLKHRLEFILEGKPYYDLFVRLNIRAFMTAEVLSHNKKPKINISWDKDWGKDVESAPWMFQGERINDHHLTLAQKMAARTNGAKP